jgi:hypothetical protein
MNEKTPMDPIDEEWEKLQEELRELIEVTGELEAAYLAWKEKK